MKKFSPAFIAALTGMSLITHAQAETNTLTAEQIERMYIDEVKVTGKTLQCFQAGQEVIHEPGLQNVKEDKARISAIRLDGSSFDVILSANVMCSIITRETKE